MKWEKYGNVEGEHEIASNRDRWTWPGVVVSYGCRTGGGWIVRLDLMGESSRLSDPFDSKEECHAAAVKLAQALYTLWPPEPEQ